MRFSTLETGGQQSALSTFAAAVAFNGGFYQEARCGIFIPIVLIFLFSLHPLVGSYALAVIVFAEELIRKRYEKR